MAPCSSPSRSFDEASKLTKYGSRASSDRFCEEGGNRDNCGPGIVCAAADGIPELDGGEVGIPDAVVPEDDLNFADAAGTGRKA